PVVLEGLTRRTEILSKAEPFLYTQDQTMTRNLAAAGIFVALTTVGCEPESSPTSYQTDAPTHPAMSAPIASLGAATSAARGMPNPHGGGSPGGSKLPAGHPPLPSKTGATDPSKVDPADMKGGPIQAHRVRFQVTEGWVRKDPANRIIEHEYMLPHAEGDAEDARFTISGAGGDLEGNIARWQGHFSGSPVTQRASEQISGLDVTIVVISGTYIGMRRTPPGKQDFVQYTAIVPGARAQVFLKAVGPRATVEKWRESLDKLVRSAEKLY
ncbi:MAG: hypothetical protein AAF488_19270, partial [Planctomycetota bacterium]